MFTATAKRESSRASAATSTWARVSRLLRDRYPMARVSEQEIRFVLIVQATRVGIRVTRHEPARAEMLQIAADLGPSINVDPWDAIQFNALLCVGALAVVDNVLWLRATMRCSDIDDVSLDQLIRHLVVEAAEVKRRLASPNVGEVLTFTLDALDAMTLVDLDAAGAPRPS